MEVKTKPWYKSWTIWFNILSVIGIVIEQYFDLIKPLVSDKAYAIIVIVVASFNLYLRIFVKTPLTLRKKEDDD